MKQKMDGIAFKFFKILVDKKVGRKATLHKRVNRGRKITKQKLHLHLAISIMKLADLTAILLRSVS